MFRQLLQFTVLSLLVCALRAQTAIAPSIASLSSSQTVTEGTSVTLSVSANGTAPFTYQWKKDGTAIAGATASTLAFSIVRVADSGSYTVVVTNSAGAVTSGAVLLNVNAAVAPTFSSQPSNLSVYAGDTLYFYASVNGSQPLTFTWKRGTTTVATTSQSSYTKTSADTTDAGTYTVTVSNIAGTVTSNTFTVTVNALVAPTLSYGPSDTSVVSGGSFFLSASFNGPGQITYQWKKDGVAIPGATSSYYNKTSATTADAGSYAVTATNAAGSTTSSAAKVTVTAPVAPTIASVSSPVSVTVGGSFDLNVSANGTSPFTYQWKKDGVAIAGATNSSYGKSSAQTVDAGVYTVTVTNAIGSATSAGITVAVTTAQPPIITYSPPSIAVQPGNYPSLSVSVAGVGPFAYQWSKNGTPIAGATSSYLSIGAGDASSLGTYTVTVSNAQGSATSQPCYVAAIPNVAPTIVSAPASQTVQQGQFVSFSSYARGTPTPSIQWRKDGTAIPGATNSTYSITSVASSDAGAYSYVATNAGGAATSADATLVVTAAAAGPVILNQPASASLLPGDYFYGLYVGVRSSSNYTVQWYRDGQPIAGASGTSYSINSAQPAAAGTYQAIVTNAAGSTTSETGVITVDTNATRPVITNVSGGGLISGGSSAYLSISTLGSGNAIQWFKDGVAISGATATSLSVNGFSTSSAGTYTARVTNASGTFTSKAMVLGLLDAGVAPTITAQPAGQNAAIGGSVNFSVSAQGEVPLSYQWRKDGVNIAGATSSSYYRSIAASTDAGAYSVVVTNRNGSTTSTNAAVAISATAVSAPIITTHPASQAISLGGYLNLSVSLFDYGGGTTFQWRKDGVAISGATGSTYYGGPAATTATAGRYTVVVTNSAGSVTSYEAIVTVISQPTGPSFTTQPQDVAAYAGKTVTFTAAATSSLPISYQWRKNGTAISGATAATLTLANIQSGDAAVYSVLASDANGSTPSATATLTLKSGAPPVFTTSPAAVTALQGTSATFTCAVSGSPTPTLQWFKDGTAIAGATGTTLTIASVQPGDAGSYSAVATSDAGAATSAAATLTLTYPPPVITAQPVAASAPIGGSATFSVTASGLPSLTYQWLKDGVAIAGGNSATLALTNLVSSAAGRYSVIVRSDFGTVTSAEVSLTVGNPISVVPPKNLTVFIGDTATFAATVTSLDPVVLAWAKNGTLIPGATSATLTIPNAKLTDAGTYVFAVSRPDGTVVYPLTGASALFATLTVVPRPGPAFATQPAGVNLISGQSLTLTASAQGTGGTIAYQWFRNGQPIAGATTATFAIGSVKLGDTGDYTLVATDANGATTSAVAHVLVEASPFAGQYFGTFASGDSWALSVDAEGRATFIALLASLGEAIIAPNLAVSPTGQFSFGASAPAQAREILAAASSPLYPGAVSGTISGGAVSGLIPGLSAVFSGRQTTADQGAPAGVYSAVPLAAGEGQLVAIAGSDGRLLLVSVDANSAGGGTGTVDRAGVFRVEQSSGAAFRGSVAAGTTSLQGTYTPTPGGTSVSFATPAAATGPERLLNLSTRGVAGPEGEALTVGFVIRGGAKDVLIRAVGPGLATYGVANALAHPRLRLYRDNAAILENTSWALGGFAQQITAAGNSVGAFPLAAGSADAALVAHLEPGGYTAQVASSDGTRGVALVELYDTTAPAAGAPKLVNLSALGRVGAGGDILIAGLVVNGSAPKKLLIRGIGPALAAFGVPGVLADPKLQLFRDADLIRENDNWSESTDASALESAAAAVGAFALTRDSKDAALILYLAPGNYTVQISGVGGQTGAAIVEIYEAP